MIRVRARLHDERAFELIHAPDINEIDARPELGIDQLAESRQRGLPLFGPAPEIVELGPLLVRPPESDIRVRYVPMVRGDD